MLLTLRPFPEFRYGDVVEIKGRLETRLNRTGSTTGTTSSARE